VQANGWRVRVIGHGGRVLNKSRSFITKYMQLKFITLRSAVQLQTAPFIAHNELVGKASLQHTCCKC
jgi:hypothetical protein